MPKTDSSSANFQHSFFNYFYRHSNQAGVVINAAVSTLVLNPFDRALYLSTTNNLPLFRRSNFVMPYKGSMAALIQKFTFGSSYYLIQGALQDHMDGYLIREYKVSLPAVDFLNGLIAGSINAAIANPYNAVKYYTYDVKHGGFFHSASVMYRLGGLQPFFKGITDGINRDIIGCVTYELGRGILRRRFVGSDHEKKAEGGSPLTTGFFCDMAAAAFGTVISGPYNFSRGIKYNVAPELTPPKTREILGKLVGEVKAASPSLAGRSVEMLSRLNVGWGTFFNSARMAGAQLIFNEVRKLAKNAEVVADTPKVSR